MQLSFRKMELVQGLIIFLALLFFAGWQRGHVNRQELGWRQALINLEPVSLEDWTSGPLQLAGAWRLTSADPRFGGISALALADDQFIAVTDSGVVVQFHKPGAGRSPARIGELPGGPGSAGFKVNRDAEALVRDGLGRGWWVAFETRNELWLYDRRFKNALARVRFERDAWPRNRGVEALVTTPDGRLLLLPERGKGVVEIRRGPPRTTPILNPAGAISDAARLPSGELVVVNRGLSAAGFRNSIATLQRRRAGYAYGPRYPLPVGRFDNVEAVAAEWLVGAVVRLWLMTDDGHQLPFRTLLLAVDMPLTRPARRPS